ncbi:MAG: FAD-dependent monooxygenase [Caldilineaceae bacterium]|nr:FAD-dependent monooxygenase [Caldilineaceae bacterium]
MNFDHPVVIVGAGPAGLATALHLAQLHPSLAADSLILDAAEHPRPKLCGGGITFHGEEQLARLHITADVPGFQVTRLLFRLDDEEFETACPRAMRVIERADFDAALAAAAQARGLRLRGNERVVDIAVDDDGAVVETTRGRYRTRVVVAADGANSTVRRKLGLRTRWAWPGPAGDDARGSATVHRLARADRGSTSLRAPRGSGLCLGLPVLRGRAAVHESQHLRQPGAGDQRQRSHAARQRPTGLRQRDRLQSNGWLAPRQSRRPAAALTTAVST